MDAVVGYGNVANVVTTMGDEPRKLVVLVQYDNFCQNLRVFDDLCEKLRPNESKPIREQSIFASMESRSIESFCN